ncbi:MAG TPA: hypothetical protein VGG28_16680 [Kofleriaceae bacterium]|jgi:hypothetical protein
MTKLLLLTSILSITACATDGTSTTDQAEPGAPDVSYVSRTGTTIEMYAQPQGSFAIAEIGGVGHTQSAIPTADAKAMSPTDIYLASATDANVPAEVSALTSKLVKAGRQFPTTSLSPVQKLQPASFDGCESSTFSATWCHLGDGDPITWCLLNRTKADNDDKTRTGLSYYKAGMCVKSGSLNYHVTDGNGADHDWTMSASEFISWTVNEAIFAHTSVSTNISDVTGTYQFAGEADD